MQPTFLFSDIFNALLACVALIDRDGVIRQVNQAWQEFAIANGLNEPSFCVGMNYLEIAKANDDPALAPLGLAGEIKAVLDGKSEKFSYEYPCHSPSEVRWYRMLVRPLRKNEATDAVIIHMDVTTQKIAELSLRRQLQVLDLIQDAILVSNLDHVITYVNRAAGDLYGWDPADMIGRKAREIFATENEEQFEKRRAEMRTQGEWSGQITHKKKSGQPIAIGARWRPIVTNQGDEAVLKVHTDLSVLSQLIRTQRMQTIGQMAGGIAHDLNNILTPMLLTAEAVKRSRKPEPEQGAKLVFLAERAGDLIKQLLGFAHGFEGEHRREPIEEMISELKKILELSLPASIDVKFHSTVGASHAVFNKTQIHQVLMNLCLNASDAMEKKGTIFIESSIENLTELKTRFGEVVNGRFFVIKVRDAGIGMTSEEIGRSFEPFYTTKEFGKGSGLGLSTCVGIMKTHGGFIDVHSQPGRGSAFSVYLPLESAAKSMSAKPTENSIVKGARLLILANDENAIRAKLGDDRDHSYITDNVDDAVSMLIGSEVPFRRIIVDARNIDSQNDSEIYWETLAQYQGTAELTVVRNDHALIEAILDQK